MRQHNNLFTLEGMRALVVGAGSGIGTETARLCADLGAELNIADISDVGGFAAELTSRHRTVRAFQCDIAERDEVDAMFEAIGPLDCLVVCAGICPWIDWNQPQWDDVFTRTINVNLRGSINCARAAFPSMVERGFGRIVLVGSMSGWMGGLAAGPDYVGSKGGIHAFVRWLARRGAPYNVLVNAVAPGPVRTPMNADQPAVLNANAVPIGRVAEPREIAAPLAFLCTPASSFVSGEVINVNGGAYMN